MTEKKTLADLRYWLQMGNPFKDTISARADALGLDLAAYKWDWVGRSLFKTGQYEPQLSGWLLQRFGSQAPCRFIDIGANLGYFSCLLAQLAGPGGRVMAVEPEPQNLALLQRNLQDNGLADRVSICPVALGAQEGQATLHLYKKANRGCHSLVAARGATPCACPSKPWTRWRSKFSRTAQPLIF